MIPTAGDLRRARLLWDYLRLGVPARPAECLLVLGGHDIGVASRAADLNAGGMAPLIVVSGGSRAVPDGSDSPTEADAIADVLLNLGVPKEAIALERLASNTSENFWLSAELLRDLGLDPASFLAVTKPYAERRTIATARRRWPAKQVSVTSEVVTFDDYLAGGIPADRILSHLSRRGTPPRCLRRHWPHRPWRTRPCRHPRSRPRPSGSRLQQPDHQRGGVTFPSSGASACSGDRLVTDPRLIRRELWNSVMAWSPRSSASRWRPTLARVAACPRTAESMSASPAPTSR